MGAETGSGTRTGEQIATFDLAAVRRFAAFSVEALSEAREEIDALNVYPVPDGDTGTNMFLTMESAREALRDHGRLLPKPGFFAQMSQTAATGHSLGSDAGLEVLGPGTAGGWDRACDSGNRRRIDDGRPCTRIECRASSV